MQFLSGVYFCIFCVPCNPPPPVQKKKDRTNQHSTLCLARNCQKLTYAKIPQQRHCDACLWSVHGRTYSYVPLKGHVRTCSYVPLKVCVRTYSYVPPESTCKDLFLCSLERTCKDLFFRCLARTCSSVPLKVQYNYISLKIYVRKKSETVDCRHSDKRKKNKHKRFKRTPYNLTKQDRMHPACCV